MVGIRQVKNGQRGVVVAPGSSVADKFVPTSAMFSIDLEKRTTFYSQFIMVDARLIVPERELYFINFDEKFLLFGAN